MFYDIIPLPGSLQVLFGATADTFGGNSQYLYAIFSVSFLSNLVLGRLAMLLDVIQDCDGREIQLQILWLQ